jgi:hypothetical protein
MFYLVDEMFRQKNKTITIIFDQPVPASTFDKSRPQKEWAELMKRHVYALGAGKKGPFSK